MYRIFCESYKNFKKTFTDDNYRLQIARPFELIVDMDRYRTEKEKQSVLYKQLCDLISFMKENIIRFPKFKAFLWTLDSRELTCKSYGISKINDLEEQAKLVNSFLKLAYWY